jgi:O-acetyl-ADP-ribose deacetylase (regulator of RNase III)
MPIIFVSLEKEFIKKVKKLNFEAYCTYIQAYKVKRKTYYVSPANSFGFMDGGIDKALSHMVFPDIEIHVRRKIDNYGKINSLGRKYLPIGSSIILDYDSSKSLVVAPTMLLPQNVMETHNAYFCTMAVLYNILVNRKEDINNVDIVFTSLCCGCGGMSYDESIKQIINGINDYKNYNPVVINKDVIFNEPNLLEQPKYYENSEFFNINPEDTIGLKYKL